VFRLYSFPPCSTSSILIHKNLLTNRELLKNVSMETNILKIITLENVVCNRCICIALMLTVNIFFDTFRRCNSLLNIFILSGGGAVHNSL